MKFRNVSRILAAAALAASGSAAWSQIVIATAGPMTGQYASFGEQMRRSRARCRYRRAPMRWRRRRTDRR